MSDVLDGVLDIVDSEERSAPEPTPAETKTPAQTEPKTEEGVAELEEVTANESDSAEKAKGETATETETEEGEPEVPSKTETSEESDDSKTKTETKENPEKAEPVDEVELTLPEPPKFNFTEPAYDEEGYITNMTPQQYQQYVIEKAKHEFRLEAYANDTENKALDAAEKILPEIKTNPAIRQLVENTRTSSILKGGQINSFEAAKLVKEALGITSAKIAEAKTQGAQNAKVSITKQKSAAVETKGSTTVKKDSPKTAELAKRLKAGDDEAFAELFDMWDEDGKLS